MMTAVTYMVLALVAYGAVVVATTFLAQPLRVKMVHLCEDMLAEDRWSKEDRKTLEWMMASSTIGSIGFLIPFCALLALGQQLVGSPRTGKHNEANKLEGDARYTYASAYYTASIMACSPVATLLSLPLMATAIVIAILRGEQQLSRVAEMPVMAASAQMRPC